MNSTKILKFKIKFKFKFLHSDRRRTLINSQFKVYKMEDEDELDLNKCGVCYDDFDDNDWTNKPYTLFPCGNYQKYQKYIKIWFLNKIISCLFLF